MAGISGMGIPSSIKAPVPGETEDQDLVNQALSVKMPAAQPSAPAEVDLDALFAEAVAPAVDLDALYDEAVGGGAEIDSRGTGTVMDGESMLNSLGQQIEEAPARFQASFAKTDKEKRFVLERKYGKENVRGTGEDFEIKKPGKKNWTKFDSDNFEIIGDLLDWGGDAVEQGITEGATLAALPAVTAEVAASPATAGTSLLAVPGTIALARGGGAVAGTAARDAVQGLMGIPRDESRNALLEYGTNAGLNALGGHLATWAGGKLAARKAAKEAGKLMSPAELFKNEIALTQEASKILKESGLYTEELSLIELAPDSREAKELFSRIASDPKVEQIFKLKNEAFDAANKNFYDSVSRFTGNKPGVGQKIGDHVEEIRKAEGKIIGDYRKQFLEQAGDGDIPVPKLQQKIAEVADSLGFQVKDNQLIKPTIEQLEELGYSKEGAKNLSSLVDKLNQKLYNQDGRVSAKELDGLYNQWSKITDNLWKRGEGADKAYRNSATKIKDAIRDAYTEKIGVVLDGNDGYKKSLAEFSGIQKNMAQVIDTMDKDKISSMAMSKHIFSKGADGLDDLKAMKGLLKDRPDLFEELTGQYYSDLVRESTDKGSGRIDWNRVNKKVSSLGPEMLEEMMGGDAKKKLDALEVIGTNLSKAQKMGGIDGPMEASIVKNMGVALASQSPHTAGTLALQLISQSDPTKVFASFLEKNGIENFLKKAPKSKQPLFRKVLNGYMAMQNNVLNSKAAQVGARVVGSDVTSKDEEN